MMGSIVCDYKYQLYKNKNNKYIMNNKKGVDLLINLKYSHRLLGTMLIPIKILCYKYLKVFCFISCGYIVIEHLSVAGTAVATICG